jgi:hypothetical protein
LPYGDQGLLIPRRLYEQVGGYRERVREDVDLARRVGSGNIRMLRSRAVKCTYRRSTEQQLHQAVTP